jgi:quinol monooxygenase YgiN
MTPSSPLGILAITTAVPGKHSALRTAQQKLVSETVTEPGCMSFTLHQSLDDPHVLVFVETWENEALWRAHMSGLAIQRFQASGANELIREFVLHRLALVADGQA